MNILANYYILLLYVVDSTVVSMILTIAVFSSAVSVHLSLKIQVRSYRPGRQHESAAHIYHRIRSLPSIDPLTNILRVCSKQYAEIFVKVSADPIESIPLLNEHDITIEYLENLENRMFQKYFKLASMIDPIIDNCYHIQIEN